LKRTLGNKYEHLWTNGCFGGGFFVILWFFWESNAQCKMHFINKKFLRMLNEKIDLKKHLLNTSRKNKIKKNKIVIVNLNMLLSLWMTKRMVNLIIWEDKYEKVLTWNCQIGHDRIDYAKIPPIQAMISHHWNII
jgi:hypothetical protein